LDCRHLLSVVKTKRPGPTPETAVGKSSLAQLTSCTCHDTNLLAFLKVAGVFEAGRNGGLGEMLRENVEAIMRNTVIVASKTRRAVRKLAAVAFGLLLFCSSQGTDTTSATDKGSVPPDSVPAHILQLFQKQANTPPWNHDSPAKTQAILQECATLQQLLADGATDDVLSNALAASHLRASVFMTFGQSLFHAGDTHHAEMFFTSVVNDHPTRATARQTARCHLWLGKLYQDDALAAKYEQQSPDQASALFQTAAAHYLAAKDASADWVRGSGWLGAATCYQEQGDQENRRTCLYGLLADTSGEVTNVSAPDVQLGFAQRDVANYLMAASYYEEHRYAEAAQVYQQMQQRLTAQLATSSPQYPNQQEYLDLANSGRARCAARQSEQAAQDPSKGSVIP
jgi:hypothetical protein